MSSLGFTFGNCSSLEKAPKIPVGVTNMNQTFYNCSSLEKAPEIPSGVTSMSETFCGCARIQKAPEIPETVKGQMSLTFSGCTSLTGNIKIKSTEISNIWRFFYETTNDLTVQVPANSTTYTTFINEYGSSSNITIETF